MLTVVVLGAGISGLSLGWFLKKRYQNQIRLIILEAASKTGGCIQTIHKNGFLFELGPHSFRLDRYSAATFQLIEELNLQKQLIAASPYAKRRYLYYKQQLQALPSSLTQCFTTSLGHRLLIAGLHDLIWPRGHYPDESIHAFATRRFGKMAAKLFIDPLTTGIYAGDPSQLSIRSCFPQWKQYEEKHGSVVMGALCNKDSHQVREWKKKYGGSTLFSFHKGMSTLTEALTQSLKNHLVTSCSVDRLEFSSGKINVESSLGNSLEADYLFSTLPCHLLAKLIPPDYEELIKHFSAVTYTTLAVVSLGYRRQILNLQGFGYLIPYNEGEDILGVIWDSSIFPEQNQGDQARLTVMIGGSRHRDIMQMSEEQLRQIALEGLAKQMGIKAIPDEMVVHWVREAIPQFEVGHLQRMEQIRHHLPSSFVCAGTTFSGVSLNGCIAYSRLLSQQI